MRLYLVRHGETKGNTAKRYVGWSHEPLTARGEAQAAALARRLATEPVSAVYSSDLTRAMQTAAALAAPHGHPVIPLAGLREANFGDWSGLTYDQIHQAAPATLQAWLSDPETSAPPGGETLACLRSRALAALPRQDRAVVVSHGGPLRAIIGALTGRPFWDISVPLCSLSILDLMPDGTALCARPGDTDHLHQ